MRVDPRLLFVLLLLAVMVYVVLIRGRWGRPAQWLLATGSAPAQAGPGESTQAATAPTTTATAPASMPTTASAPATAPATGPAWNIPVFTARQADRDAMVRQIAAYGLKDEKVLKLMRAVPRHEFVPRNQQREAYRDTPLPIGHGQTISQPYIVAEMTRLLELTDKSRVLEIGTGSGYQAAVLAHITPQVYTIEIVEPLAESARKRLERLGYANVTACWADGWWGWKQKGPFDAIIVTCAARQIPPPLVQQLKPDGRMVIPVGGPLTTQMLMLVQKRPDGAIRTTALMPVRFVPLLRGAKKEQ